MQNKKHGLISQIIIVFIGLVALGFYFRIDIISFIEKPETMSVLDGLKNGIRVTWMYIKDAVAYVGGLFD